jgi:hypothetical protein
MLTAWSKTCGQCNTLIGWETLFARIASAIDDVPIARGSASASTDLGWEIITPNRLKLGRNNYRQLDGPTKLDNCPQTQLERNRLSTCKWYEILINRIHLLIPSPQRKDSPQPDSRGRSPIPVPWSLTSRNYGFGNSELLKRRSPVLRTKSAIPTRMVQTDASIELPDKLPS